VVRPDPQGKAAHKPRHIGEDGEVVKVMGPAPWPLYGEAEALEAEGWVVEAEGPKCADWVRAGGVVGISQPGHAHNPEDIEPRYRRLQAAGVVGIVFLADNDKQGKVRLAEAAGVAAEIGLPFLPLPALSVWPGIPGGGSIDDAPGTPAERVAALVAAIPAAVDRQQADATPTAETAPEPPFRILGWNQKRDGVWIQSGGIGQVAAVPMTKAGLQRIAPLPYWEGAYAGRLGVDWDRAISAVFELAQQAGVFTPNRLRGRGVWLDRGRVVWNLGDRLEIDGSLMPFTEAKDTAYTYACLTPLEINPEVEPLTDQEGAEIVDLWHRRMTWYTPGDGLLLLGQIVIGNVGGAMDIRPGVQLTGPSQGGKSTVINGGIKPLQGGLGIYSAGSTEAGIRQVLQLESLPAVIDESEQEMASQREGHLRLLRLSFDGQEQIKGSQGGQPVRYSMRSAITLSGINATVPNLADRNRLVIIKPRKMAAEDWQDFQLRRNALVSRDTGCRLIRRTVTHLPALLANIKVFTAVLGGMLATSRSAEVYGCLLAGAHHLTTSVVVSPEAALAWLDRMDWRGLDDEDAAAIATDVEGQACLEALLAHPVPWKASLTGSTDVRGLLAIAKSHKSVENASDAIRALGQRGIKLETKDQRILVSHGCTVFARTRWDNGAHRDRLLELPGAELKGDPVRFTGGASRRAVTLPMKLADLTG
jgi:hypothetical protein